MLAANVSAGTDEQIERLFHQSCEFDRVLLDDLMAAKAQIDAVDVPFARRTYCRTLMAFFEGIVNDMKIHVLALESHALGKDEIKLLQTRLGALESAFNSFDLYADVAGTKSPLERDSNEWRILAKAIKIRNRIAHPRSALSLEISDRELEDLKAAEEAIFDLTACCIKSVAKARLTRLRKLEKRRNEFLDQHSPP